jgi:hypothetical protein
MNAFWMIFSLIALAGSIYLGVWSYQNDSNVGTSVLIILVSFFTVGMIFSNFKLFKIEGSFQASSFYFLIGGAVMIALKLIAKYVWSTPNVTIFSSLTTSGVYSTVLSEMPTFWSGVVNNFTIPVVEETFFLIGLPCLIIMICDSLAERDKFTFLESKGVQLGLVMIVSIIGFLVFHVRQLASTDAFAFAISLLIFRLIVVGLFWGDELFDFIPFAKVLPAFGLGCHIVNNMMSPLLNNGVVVGGGIFYHLGVLATNPFGWIIITLLAVVVFFGLKRLIDVIFGGASIDD